MTRQNVQKLDEGYGQMVVERQDELGRFDEWFNNGNPATVVCSVSGIGGIGKTTFLGQIAKRARGLGIKTVRVDGDLMIATPSQLLFYVCDQVGLNLPYGGARGAYPMRSINYRDGCPDRRPSFCLTISKRWSP